jgi:hypothetical protein
MYSNTYWRATRSTKYMDDSYEDYANWYGSRCDTGYRYNSAKKDYGTGKTMVTDRDGKVKTWDEYVASRPERRDMANKQLGPGRGATGADFTDETTQPEITVEVAGVDPTSFRSESERAVEAVEAVNSQLAAEAKSQAEKAVRKVVEGGGTSVHQLIQVSKRDSQGIMRTWYELEPLGQAVVSA